MTKEDYAKKAYQWAKALKLLDPTITLILCGETGYSDWDRYVLQQCIKWTDMHSIHIYTSDNDHLPNTTAPLSAERSIQIVAAAIDQARIQANCKTRPTICFDEWNIWDPVRAPGDKGAEELYTVSDMLAMSVWCNVFIRQSKWLGMTNIAQNVNVIAPVMTTPHGLVKQTIYFPYYLFANYMRGHTLGVHLRCGTYDGRTQPEWVATTMETPWLDVSASLNEGVVGLAVANIHPSRAFEVEIRGLAGGVDVEVYYVTGGKLEDVNTEEKQTVGIEEGRWVSGGRYRFPKHSFTLLRWRV